MFRPAPRAAAPLRNGRTTPRGRLPTLLLRLRREAVWSDRPALLLLMVLVVALTVLGLVQPKWVPYSAMLLPMILGSMFLWPRSLPWFIVFCLCGVVALMSAQFSINERSVMRIVVVFVIAGVIMVTAFRRSNLGVSGPRGESMLVDLRDRIKRQGAMPPLPAEWDVTSALKTAGGTQFAGDFVVASLDQHGSGLEVVVVDVSGKGVEAGTRALLLSGAFGGLASAVPPEQFLPEANTYLLRQSWGEGFATAAYLHLDLASGDFEVRTAGHPPPVWLHAGSGEISVLEAEGPILGLVPEAEFLDVRGRLEPGDALLLYTDGLVETSKRDLTSGIDRLAGRAQRQVQKDFAGGAEALVEELATPNDDGAMVLVHRR